MTEEELLQKAAHLKKLQSKRGHLQGFLERDHDNNPYYMILGKDCFVRYSGSDPVTISVNNAEILQRLATALIGDELTLIQKEIDTLLEK